MNQWMRTIGMVLAVVALAACSGAADEDEPEADSEAALSGGCAPNTACGDPVGFVGLSFAMDVATNKINQKCKGTGAFLTTTLRVSFDTKKNRVATSIDGGGSGGQSCAIAVLDSLVKPPRLLHAQSYTRRITISLQ